MNSTERVYRGIPVSPGIAIGHAFVMDRLAAAVVEVRELQTEQEVEAEVDRFQKAIDISREQLARIRGQVAQAIDEKHADIFVAQAEFLNDPELIDKTLVAIRRERKNAEYLFHRRVDTWMHLISTIEDETFKARNSDLLDVANRVMSNLAARQPDFPHKSFPPKTVLLAPDLTPSETTNLMKAQIQGIVLEKGGPTSHTAIMAKALEIPAVVGVQDLGQWGVHRAPVIVDGQTGFIIVDPSEQTLAWYEAQKAELAVFEKELRELKNLPAETQDGYSVTMRANVELLEETEHAKDYGACGVGLFRTEFLFMNRSEVPEEEEQFQIYKKVLERAAPNPVVFRTLDFGGDKFLQGGETGELNPYMGQRAIRLSLSKPELFRTQIRAMLRASSYGPTRILIPMISGVEEFMNVKKHVRRVKAELRLEKVPFNPRVQLGAMIEIPSAAVVADDLARECDFFSIGTNDLIQYSLAVDRGNEKVAYLYEALHPAVLRLMRNTIQAARKAGIPVSVCGEMAAEPMTAIILLGMGVDELSMSAVNIPQVKRMIRAVELTDAQSLAEEVLNQGTIEGIKKVLNRRLKKLNQRNLPKSINAVPAGLAVTANR